MTSPGLSALVWLFAAGWFVRAGRVFDVADVVDFVVVLDCAGLFAGADVSDGDVFDAVVALLAGELAAFGADGVLVEEGALLCCGFAAVPLAASLKAES